MSEEMLDKQEQDKLLRALKDGGGYGMLGIVDQYGDVLFAVSPVPKLIGYEIVCASPERLYDIWKDRLLETPNQTKQQVKEWIRENTPAWLYDDSEPTEEQKTLVATWISKLQKRYPGTLELG